MKVSYRVGEAKPTIFFADVAGFACLHHPHFCDRTDRKHLKSKQEVKIYGIQ